MLRHEWRRVGATSGPVGGPDAAAAAITGKAHDMLSLDRPSPDWVAIARGHGVEATRVDTAQGLAQALRLAYGRRGPRLIEAWL